MVPLQRCALRRRQRRFGSAGWLAPAGWGLPARRGACSYCRPTVPSQCASAALCKCCPYRSIPVPPACDFHGVHCLRALHVRRVLASWLVSSRECMVRAPAPACPPLPRRLPVPGAEPLRRPHIHPSIRRRRGRVLVMWMAAAAYLVAASLQAGSQNLPMLYSARAVVGCGMALWQSGWCAALMLPAGGRRLAPGSHLGCAARAVRSPRPAPRPPPRSPDFSTRLDERGRAAEAQGRDCVILSGTALFSLPSLVWSCSATGG